MRRVLAQGASVSGAARPFWEGLVTLLVLGCSCRGGDEGDWTVVDEVVLEAEEGAEPRRSRAEERLLGVYRHEGSWAGQPVHRELIVADETLTHRLGGHELLVESCERSAGPLGAWDFVCTDAEGRVTHRPMSLDAEGRLRHRADPAMVYVRVGDLADVIVESVEPGADEAGGTP